MQLTADSPRQNLQQAATIRRITRETPSIKTLELEVDSAPGAFRFEAGQWIDLFIPHMETVGGFSLVSAPAQLPMLELAVKESDHAPARWCFQEAREGDAVQIRVGGSFTLDGAEVGAFCGPQSGGDGAPNMLLVAGGIGVNPLFSMFGTVAEKLGRDPTAHRPDRRCHMLYSARTEEELLFRERIERMSALHGPVLSHEFRITEQGRNRIDAAAVEAALAEFAGPGGRPPVVYICGPPQFTDDVEAYCLAAGLPAECVRLERWW